MVKVIYWQEPTVNMIGELGHSIVPCCPVCKEWTYGEDTCPFCRMKGQTVPLEYDGKKHPVFIKSDGSPAERCHCGVCGGS